MFTSLTPTDVAAFQALGITPAVLERMQVQRVTDADARDLLALISFSGQLGGIVFPYRVPWLQFAVTHRLRRDQPDYEQGKPKNKYVSAYADKHHFYFADVDLPALSDTSTPIIIVEAEKSVLAIVCAAEGSGRRALAIGLGGCWGWRGRIGKVETANGGHADERGPLPDFDHIVWTGRDVVLAFDSDVATNPKVGSARRALASELTRRGASIRFLNILDEDGINGPDDYIGRYKAERFFALFDAAPDAITLDHIFRLNRKHAVVSEMGKTVVITECHEPVLNRIALTRSSFADLKNRYMAEVVRTGLNKKTGEPTWGRVGDLWLAHTERRQYDGIVMSPGRDVPGYLNLWRGFAVPPEAGDWSRFKAHVFEVICASNIAMFDYILAWMANGVQHPDQQAEVALALRGGRGAGKGIFARAYGELFGQHFVHIANAQHLTGHFNAHLQDAIVLFVDEAFWAGDKQGESVLKMLVTEPSIAIEAKGRDVIQTKNLLHIIMASNHDWVVPAGVDERRFCVLDVDAAYQQDYAYFDAIVSELDHGGRAAMLYDLLQHDCSDINLRRAPATEALREQKVLSMQPAEKWLLDKLMAGRWMPGCDQWEAVISKAALHDDYVRAVQKIGIPRRSSETELGTLIRNILGDSAKTCKRAVRGGTGREPVWEMGTLQACRAAFDKATHSHHPWPVEEEDDLAA